MSCSQSSKNDSRLQAKYSEIKEYDIKVNFSKSFMIKEVRKGSTVSDIHLTGIGFKGVSKTIHFKHTKPIYDFLVCDVNNDGFEELYIITQSGKKKPKAEIIGIVLTENESYRKIFVADNEGMAENDNFAGYVGFDSIYIKEQHLYRNFLVKDSNNQEFRKTVLYTLYKYEDSYALNARVIEKKK